MFGKPSSGRVVRSPSPKFGGWSALEIDPGGGRILAISDVGLWMTAGLSYDGGALSGLGDARIGPLTGIGGAPLTRPRDRDAEGVVQLEGTVERTADRSEVNHRSAVSITAMAGHHHIRRRLMCAARC
jgi:hypothetical protein